MATIPRAAKEENHIPVLPINTSISYLAEGAANIVFRISIPGPSPPPSVIEEYGAGTPPPTEIEDVEEKLTQITALDGFDDKLLRLRKDLPTTVPCAVSHANWLRLIVALFDADQLVQQRLVQLRPAKIVERFNQKLYDWEHGTAISVLSPIGVRPAIRRGVYLADDPHGFLITEMTSRYDDEVIQLKPKWLVQSPSAPAGAKRCRTCAKAARTAAKLSRQGQNLPRTQLCPLDLVSQDKHDISWVVSQVLTDSSKASRLEQWLRSNTLLKRLRDAQYRLDPNGTIEAESDNENILLAMTLRDCTLYIRLPEGEKDDSEIEARIGDLDLKSPNKSDYWKMLEKQLIDEGWYTGDEEGKDRQPLTCSLSPGRWEILGQTSVV